MLSETSNFPCGSTGTRSTSASSQTALFGLGNHPRPRVLGDEQGGVDQRHAGAPWCSFKIDFVTSLALLGATDPTSAHDCSWGSRV
jgi:hypothetical protein